MSCVSTQDILYRPHFILQDQLLNTYYLTKSLKITLSVLIHLLCHNEYLIYVRIIHIRIFADNDLHQLSHAVSWTIITRIYKLVLQCRIS